MCIEAQRWVAGVERIEVEAVVFAFNCLHNMHKGIPKGGDWGDCNSGTEFFECRKGQEVEDVCGLLTYTKLSYVAAFSILQVMVMRLEILGPVMENSILRVINATLPIEKKKQSERCIYNS